MKDLELNIASIGLKTLDPGTISYQIVSEVKDEPHCRIPGLIIAELDANALNPFKERGFACQLLGLGLGLPPWMRQTDKTQLAVRCKTVDRRHYFTAF